jgi:hypothetical protein
MRIGYFQGVIVPPSDINYVFANSPWGTSLMKKYNEVNDKNAKLMEGLIKNTPS